MLQAYKVSSEIPHPIRVYFDRHRRDTQYVTEGVTLMAACALYSLCVGGGSQSRGISTGSIIYYIYIAAIARCAKCQFLYEKRLF